MEPSVKKRISANVLNLTDGLFLQCGRDVAAGFPDIAFEDCMVDALCLRLVKQPETIDVLTLPNQYGDILSDLCGGIAGSLGLAPGANIGEQVSLRERSSERYGSSLGSGSRFRRVDRVGGRAGLPAEDLVDHAQDRFGVQVVELSLAELSAHEDVYPERGEGGQHFFEILYL